jgi:hypothetical protein
VAFDWVGLWKSNLLKESLLHPHSVEVSLLCKLNSINSNSKSNSKSKSNSNSKSNSKLIFQVIFPVAMGIPAECEDYLSSVLPGKKKRSRAISRIRIAVSLVLSIKDPNYSALVFKPSKKILRRFFGGGPGGGGQILKIKFCWRNYSNLFDCLLIF